MSNQKTIYLNPGYALTINSLNSSDITYYELGNPGEAPGLSTAVPEQTVISIGPFNTDKYYVITNGNGAYEYSIDFSGFVTQAEDVLLAATNQAITELQIADQALAPKASPTFTGTVVLPSTTSIGTVSSTEIGYLDSVTSAIQTQLNNRALVGATVIAPIANDANGTAIATAVNGIITALIAAGILAIA